MTFNHMITIKMRGNMNQLIKYRWFLLTFLGFFLQFQSCVPVQPRSLPGQEIQNQMPRELIEKEMSGTIQELKLPQALPEPVDKIIAEDPRRLTLLFDRATLGEAVHAITRDIRLNLSVDSEVDLNRTVTVHLNDVSLKDALDMIITQAAGYAWTSKNGFLQIKRFEERIYHLDYLDMLGGADIEVGGDMLASSVEGSGVAGKYTLKAKNGSEEANIWSSVKDTLEGLKSEQGILRVNPRSGMVYMADSPRRVASMVRFLDSLSEVLHRQVFIEAKILEVSLSDDYRYGIDWSALGVAFKSDSGALPDVFQLNFNDGTVVLNSQSSFAAILDFLRTQGDVTVLSNPHISVMNGQSALMTVGYQFPFGDITGVDRDLDTNNITYSVTIKRAILGLQLGITALVSDQGMITLHIVPTITRIQREEDVEIPVGGTTTQTISNPVIDLQELSTTARVRQGQSVVLAGLISQMRKFNHQGLPWLSKVPLLGHLFKHQENTEENRELVIWLTPYIKKTS